MEVLLVVREVFLRYTFRKRRDFYVQFKYKGQNTI